MIEKKTFKNPLIETELDGACWVVTHSEGLGSPYGQFHRDRWDMEVTFTKKPLKFEVGEKVRDRFSGAYLYTVIGQWKDQVIVVDPDDDEIEFFDDVDLKREV